MNKDEEGKIFGFFVNEGKKLNNYVRKKIRSINDMDAEDIVSDVMLYLFNKPDITARIENLAAYVTGHSTTRSLIIIFGVIIGRYHLKATLMKTENAY